LNIFNKTVNDFLWKTLLQYQNEPYFDNFHLVGGTSLSLQIGHRISDDIDLFTKDKLDKEKLFEYAKKIQKNVEILNDGEAIYQLYFPDKELKIDFVQYPYDLIEPVIKTKEGLHIIGKNDIAAMKMSATGTRGYEAKDFVDLFYLLKEIPIDTIIENFKKKYETENPIHYIRSMVYFDDVKLDSWKSIKMINDPLSVKEIKDTLVRNVRDYEKRMFNMNKKDTGNSVGR